MDIPLLKDIYFEEGCLRQAIRVIVSLLVMNAKQRQIKARKSWIKCYQDLGSVNKAALKCGIPRSMPYRWINRFEECSTDGLRGLSQRPKKLAKQKINEEITSLIKSIRFEYNFGPQRISTHLPRIHKIAISAPTVLASKGNNLPNIKKYRKHNDITRYNRPIPGDRVQIDVTKIALKCYQFTAIDDCTRLRAVRLYPNKKAESTVDFLGHILDTFEFPIHRTQTDWRTEFFNDLFQEELMVHYIKFRPIKLEARI